MRVVAGDAGHVALLETLALPQVLNLVGDVIVFGMFSLNRAEVLVQPLPRSERESGVPRLDGITVALGAHLDL